MLVRFCFWLFWSHPKRKLVFQPFTFRCYVSFREGTSSIRWNYHFIEKNPSILAYNELMSIVSPIVQKYLRSISSHHWNLRCLFKIRMLCACVLSFDKLDYSKRIDVCTHLSQLPPRCHRRTHHSSDASVSRRLVGTGIPRNDTPITKKRVD